MKRIPDATLSPSKLQRFEVRNIVVDAEQPPSQSGTPQSRRSSSDPFRATFSNAPSEPTFDSAKMSNFVKCALFDTSFEVPQGLIDEINKRNCIAFVGSGFTAPLIGDWNKLLKMLLEDARLEVDDWNLKNPESAAERDEQFNFLVEKADKLRGASSAEYDYFAQEIEDLVGETRFQHLIQKRCRLDDSMIISNLMKTRLEALSRIPFKAIITTNYNNCFVGKVATMHGELDETHFEEILRPEKDFQQGAHDSASKAEVLNATSPSPPRGDFVSSASPPPECSAAQSSLELPRMPTPNPPEDSVYSSEISDCHIAQAVKTQSVHPKPDEPSGMTLHDARAKYACALWLPSVFL